MNNSITRLFVGGQYVGYGSDLIDLGWEEWGDYAGQGSETSLYLCPVEQFKTLPDGAIIHSIFGDVKIVGRDKFSLDEIDERRNGVLIFGLMARPFPPKDKPRYRKLDEPFEPSMK